jgi:hypothetical protein
MGVLWQVVVQCFELTAYGGDILVEKLTFVAFGMIGRAAGAFEATVSGWPVDVPLGAWGVEMLNEELLFKDVEDLLNSFATRACLTLPKRLHRRRVRISGRTDSKAST